MNDVTCFHCFATVLLASVVNVRMVGQMGNKPFQTYLKHSVSILNIVKPIIASNISFSKNRR